MHKIAIDTMARFFEAAGVDLSDPATKRVQWRDVAEIFWPLRPHFEEQARRAGKRWDWTAPLKLDDELIKMALTGQAEGNVTIPPDLMEEMWRRWEWVVTGAVLEMDARTQLEFPIPKNAPGHVQAWGVILYFLLGPGREYRR